MIMGAGPAHAVHFGTYEMVKEFAGGNVEGGHNQWIATCAYSHIPCTRIPVFFALPRETDLAFLSPVMLSDSDVSRNRCTFVRQTPHPNVPIDTHASQWEHNHDDIRLRRREQQ